MKLQEKGVRFDAKQDLNKNNIESIKPDPCGNDLTPGTVYTVTVSRDMHGEFFCNKLMRIQRDSYAYTRTIDAG